MTTIEWTDETWNPVVGCERISPGCDHCYAIGVAHRAMQPAHVGLTIKRPGKPTDWTGVVRCLPERLDIPLRWKKPRRVFVNSMSDLFHPDVPPLFIAEVWASMIASGHTFQVLTKRPSRMRSLIAAPIFKQTAIELVHRKYGTHVFAGWPYPTIWLGTSIESRRYAWRAERLRETPAAVRFLSVEPMLGHLGCDLESLDGIHWVIVGAESGHGARSMDLDWARALRDRCAEDGIAFFVKQLSGPGGKAIKDINQFPEDLRIREWPKP
jgi:protein gp37